MIRNFSRFVPLILLSFVLLSCSSHNYGTSTVATIPDISGAWEFQANSTYNASTYTGIEVGLKEGQVVVNGLQSPNGQVSASGLSQIAIVSVNPTSATVVFGGSCALSGTGTYNLSGTIASLGGPFNFTYTENGNVFNVTGSLSGDGKSFQGTYTSATGSACPDGGTITGTSVPKLTGSYVGQFTLPDGTSESVTVTLSENSSSVLSANLVGTTPNAINFTLTGPATGNAFLLQGTYQGQQVTYEGYFGVQVLGPITNAMVSGVYFVNSTNPSNLIPAGTLIPPNS